MNITKKYLAVSQIVLVLLLLGAGGVYQSNAFAEDDIFDTLRLNRFPEPVDVPDFTLPALDGKEMKISDYKGNIIFLNFWTTW